MSVAGSAEFEARAIRSSRGRQKSRITGRRGACVPVPACAGANGMRGFLWKISSLARLAPGSGLFRRRARLGGGRLLCGALAGNREQHFGLPGGTLAALLALLSGGRHPPRRRTAVLLHAAAKRIHQADDVAGRLGLLLRAGRLEARLL